MNFFTKNLNFVLFQSILGTIIVPLTVGKLKFPITLSSKLRWANKGNESLALEKFSSHECHINYIFGIWGSCFSAQTIDYYVLALQQISEFIFCDKHELCELAADSTIVQKWLLPSHIDRDSKTWTDGIDLYHSKIRLGSQATSQKGIKMSIQGPAVTFMYFKSIRMSIHGYHYSFNNKRGSTKATPVSVKAPSITEQGHLNGLIGIADLCSPEDSELISSIENFVPKYNLLKIMCRPIHSN